MTEIKVGDIVEGTIISIKDFGAIMIFSNGRKGLLHISEVANVFIRNIRKYLKVGKTYQVKVLSIEDDGFLKISMSKITQEEKEAHNSQVGKKTFIDEEYIDFSALKKKIPQWIKQAKENSND